MGLGSPGIESTTLLNYYYVIEFTHILTTFTTIKNIFTLTSSSFSFINNLKLFLITMQTWKLVYFKL